MKILRTILVAGSLCLLISCGGGSGGGVSGGSTPSQITSTLSFPLRSAVIARATNGASYTLFANGTSATQATDGLCSGTLTETVSPANLQTTFEGQPTLSNADIVAVNYTNCSTGTPSSSSTEYFDTSYLPVGATQSGSYALVSGSYAVPTSVKVGDTGTIGSATIYTDSTKSVSKGRTDKSFVVEPDTATTAIVNVISKAYDASSQLLYTDQTRYRIDAAGAFTVVSDDIQFSKTSTNHLVFRSGGSTVGVSYVVGGSIKGLGSAAGLVLRNRNETISFTDNQTSFVFTVPLAQGTTYGVTVQSQPTGQVCSVDNGSGTVGDRNVANVLVTCLPLPTVVNSVPANGASAVPVSTPISFTFSVPLDPASVTTSSFTVVAGPTPVAGTVSVSGAVATFTPSAPLAANTTYTANVSGNVKNQAGTMLGGNFYWVFQTKSFVSVVAISPAPYSYPVALNSIPTATFSNPVDPNTVNTSTFTLSGPLGLIPGSVGYSGSTATFTPTNPLSVNTVYRASINNNVKDLAGDSLAIGRTWTFQTFAPGTATTPQPFTPIPVGLWQPAPGATPSSGNFVYLQSDAGDYIGGGQTYTYTPLNAQLTFASPAGGTSVQVNGNDWWNGYFFGPTAMSQLQVGYYSGLMRWPFYNPVLGGLDWSGNGRGCNTLLGWFAVDNVSYSSGSISTLDLRFEQQCEGGQNALHGSIHFGP